MENALFPPGDLYLRHPQAAGHLSLGLSAIVPQKDQLPVPFLQRGKQLLQRKQIAQPLLRALLRQVYLPAAILLTPRQGKRRRGGGQGLGHILRGTAHAFGYLIHGGLPAQLAAQQLSGAPGGQSQLLQAAAHLYGAPIPEQPADLPQDDRHGIGGKHHPPAGIKGRGGLHQPHAPGLVQVVVFYAPPLKAMGAGVHQPQVVFHAGILYGGRLWFGGNRHFGQTSLVTGLFGSGGGADARWCRPPHGR